VKSPPANVDEYGKAGAPLRRLSSLGIEPLKTFSLPLAIRCSRVRWYIEMRDGELEGAVVGENGKWGVSSVVMGKVRGLRNSCGDTRYFDG